MLTVICFCGVKVRYRREIFICISARDAFSTHFRYFRQYARVYERFVRAQRIREQVQIYYGVRGQWDARVSTSLSSVSSSNAEKRNPDNVQTRPVARRRVSPFPPSRSINEWLPVTPPPSALYQRIDTPARCWFGTIVS